MYQGVVQFNGQQLDITEPVLLQQVYNQRPMGTSATPMLRSVSAGLYDCEERDMIINGQLVPWLVIELDGDTLGLPKSTVEILSFESA